MKFADGWLVLKKILVGIVITVVSLAIRQDDYIEGGQATLG